MWLCDSRQENDCKWEYRGEEGWSKSSRCFDSLLERNGLTECFVIFQFHQRGLQVAFWNFFPISPFFFFKSTGVCHTMHLLLLWHFLKLEEQIHSFTSVLQQSITCQWQFHWHSGMDFLWGRSVYDTTFRGDSRFPLMEEGRYINSLSLSTSPLRLKTELQLNLNSLAWGQVKWVINTNSGSWAWIHMSIDNGFGIQNQRSKAQPFLKQALFLVKHLYSACSMAVHHLVHHVESHQVFF